MIGKKFFQSLSRSRIREIKNLYAKFSPTYYHTKKFIKKTEYLPEKSLKNLQFRLLKNTLIHSYEKVPYYREIFRKERLDPHDIDEFRDLSVYPFLTKDQYRKNIDKFISKDALKIQLIEAYTGGTTGFPVPLYRTPSDFAREKAFTDYVYHMLGMDPFCKTVYIRGEVYDKRGCYHKIGNLGKTLYLSSHNMSEKNLKFYIKLIKDFKPLLLYTLPSIAVILADFMERNHIAPFNGLRWVFTPSENLYKFQEKQIENVLNCQVGTFYGHSEHAVMASRCNDSTMYHVLPQYGYAELIDKNGKPITEEGEQGEIVATSFTNLCCPLIRYRTGDYAVYTNKKCSCGRNYQMWQKITGREQAIAIAKNDGLISIGPDLLCTIRDNVYMKIKQFGIEQRKAGELILHVLPHRISDIVEIREYFENIFDEIFPGCFDITIELKKSDIKKHEKHRYFIQKINRSNTR